MQMNDQPPSSGASQYRRLGSKALHGLVEALVEIAHAGADPGQAVLHIARLAQGFDIQRRKQGDILLERPRSVVVSLSNLASILDDHDLGGELRQHGADVTVEQGHMKEADGRDRIVR